MKKNRWIPEIFVYKTKLWTAFVSLQGLTNAYNTYVWNDDGWMDACMHGWTNELINKSGSLKSIFFFIKIQNISWEPLSLVMFQNQDMPWLIIPMWINRDVFSIAETDIQLQEVKLNKDLRYLLFFNLF